MGADWDSLGPGPPGALEGGVDGIYPDGRYAGRRGLMYEVIRAIGSRSWCASAHVSALGRIRPLAPPRGQNGGACGPSGRHAECITPDLQGSWYLRRLWVVFIMNLRSGLLAGSSKAQGLPLEVAEEVKKKKCHPVRRGSWTEWRRRRRRPSASNCCGASPFFVFGLGRDVPAWTDGFAAADLLPLALKAAL